MKLKNIAIIIPARLASTRLPSKPLADIVGKTMIERVYNQALLADLGEVYIACDGIDIANEIKNFGGKFIITDPNLPSGTDRIYAALQQIKNFERFEIIINLQGDLPLIDPQVIKAAAAALESSGAEISTVASIIKNEQEILNPNIVKIAISFAENKNFGQALYFSRSPIPHGSGEYYHHIGIYAYKNSALKKFVNLKPSSLEKRESLEQLRALENGMKIAVQIVDTHPFSVDTKEDLEVVKKLVMGE